MPIVIASKLPIYSNHYSVCYRDVTLRPFLVALRRHGGGATLPRLVLLNG